MTDIGFFLSGEEIAPDTIVSMAQAADRAGIEKLWVSDHYHPWMSSQDESPFVWSVLGAVAATTDLHVTTAVTCPTFRIHPSVVAQAAATTAVLAPGRFTLGVGSGEALNEHIHGEAWPSVGKRLERLEEAIGLIRALWTGDVVTHEGPNYRVYDAKLWSLPETPPEIYVSGFGPRAVELAARVGDGWIAASPDADGMKAYRDGGGTGRTQAGLKICWAETEKEAAETAHRTWGHEVIGTEGQLLQDIPMWMGFEALRDGSSPDAMAEAVPCGPDAAKVAEAIAEYVEIGFDEVYVSQMGPDQEGGLAFLTEQVLPLVK